MATQAHASPSQEPGASALESLDDLLNKQQTEQGAQLSAGDDPNTTSSSSITITPQSPLRAPRPRDESRWNGFHLWRTESYNRAATERAAEEEEHRREEHGWVKDLEAKVKSVYQRSQEALFGKREDTNETKDGSMSWIKLFLLTVVMAGAQLAWCLEFGYGTPYLLSIGLSKASTSFVWLCAPLSGLVMQPLIGVLSDLSTSSFRRRQYIIYSLIFLIPSTLVIAFSQPIASILVDILHTGLADWDPARKQALDDINRFIAILSFVILDLSINSLQAAARALILDTAPTSQHSRANAWLGRMTHVGNVAGYAAGWYDLSSTKALIWLGGGQFRKYAFVSMVGVTICSITTCVFIKENVREGLHDGQTGTGVIAKSKEALYHIYQAIRRLPRPVRRICLVQLFAFMGWFPFLFYATQWVIEIRQKETDGFGSGDAAAEKGSFALLMFSLVALVSGSLLPYLCLSNSSEARSIYLSGPENQLLSNDDQQETKPRRKLWKLTLRTMWTISLVIYSLQAAVLTFAVQTTNGAIMLLASIGLPWAVASWVPFALVMESIREAEDGMSPFEFEADWFAPERVRSRRESSHSAVARARVARAIQDCEPLSSTPSSKQSQSRKPSTILSRGTEVVQPSGRQASVGSIPVPTSTYENSNEGNAESQGGTVLGIHNLAIVLPQFVVAIFAALILRSKTSQGNQYAITQEADNGVSVVWVIRLGGVAAIFAAILTRFVPLTRTERQMRGEEQPIQQEPRYDDEVAEGETED